MSARDADLRKMIATKASQIAAGRRPDPGLISAINHARISAYARKIQAGAPPLTDDQIEDIVAVLVGRSVRPGPAPTGKG